MSIIFLDFSRNFAEVKTSKGSFYNYSLNEQYETIKVRIPSYKLQTSSLDDLIEKCFPTGLTKNYYFSCPNFRRNKIEDKNGVGLKFLNNIVIRPEFTYQMGEYLPNNTTIILLGDIQETNRLNSFIVKGIELIDKNIAGASDIVEENSYCVSTYGKKLGNDGVNHYTEWSIPRPNIDDTLFSPDFISSLIKYSYPLTEKNITKLFKTFNDWDEYLGFREKYLKLQTKRNIKIDHIEFVRAYAVSRKNYNRNQEEYEKNLLVNHDSFKKGEQILLKSPTENSDEFPLIVVYKDYNKKSFESQKVETKNGKRVNPEEKIIKDFTRENLSLSKTIPREDNSYEKILSESFSLDERYRFIDLDIEPDCNDLEEIYKKKIIDKQNKIDDRFKLKIKQELSTYLDLEKQKLDSEYSKKVKELNDNFYANIDEIVKKNEDKEIKETIKNLIKQYKNNQLESKIKKIKNQDKKLNNEDIRKLYQKELNGFENSIDIRSLYINKFDRESKKLSSKWQLDIDNKLKQLEKNKATELKNLYAYEIEDEKVVEKKKQENECNQKIQERIENQTIKRFQIYFKVNIENINFLDNFDFKTFNYLIYDYKAENAKLRRQRDALNNFIDGNVKNPYLATYLFATGELNKTDYDFSNWQWFLESLNEKQKEAVQKAVSSKGVFLLQGPPGTGKTQVIAEIIGHLVKEGKKVLVASETHKAIDNVFERLPLIADIRPLRLVASRSSKETEFGPENLVDNFYSNISRKMSSIIHNYENFKDYKDDFFENYQKQKYLSDRIERFKTKINEIDKQIKNHQQELDRLKSQREDKEVVLDSKEEERSRLVRTRNRLDNLKFTSQDEIDYSYIEGFVKEALKIIVGFDVFINDQNSIVEILSIDMKTLEEELRIIKRGKNEFEIEQKKKELREKIQSFQDEFGEFIKGKEDLYKPLQKELKELSEKSSFDTNNFKVLKFILLGDINRIDKNTDIIIRTVMKTREDLNAIKSKYIDSVDQKIEKIDRVINDLQSEVNMINSNRSSIQEKIRQLQNDNDYQSVQDEEILLRRQISKFIEDFNVNIEYRDYQEALIKISDNYIKLDLEYTKEENENKKKIPIYTKISEYLKKEEVISEDRKEYTKFLFGKVNLFGITNTSRDSFKENSNNALTDYSLGDLDLKKQGIDVVIIDEVSKSSFIDLLIPILYGKSVILVGDHRQLPPMYEFRNLRDEDFENIEEDVLTKRQNDSFMKMYEEGFFKTLFERVPDDYKVMLDQQYRSHEHIMHVYNCFYNNKLRIGYTGQNKAKEHHLKIISNNRLIIDPNKHVYFVDCKQFESREADSTSIYNSNEAEVVVKLLQLINDGYKNNPNFKFRKNRDIDERMSVGVICTYGDQARIIKNKLKNSQYKFDMFNEKSDGKLIISTVDDFQGDERDIIVLSMVRNPENRKKSNPGFILAYQRINVALSRARRLLIVVGNQSYLQDKGVIDLPDVFGLGNDKKNFHVYNEVIASIKTNGILFDDEDVLGGRK